jgi:hypothetical protein
VNRRIEFFRLDFCHKKKRGTQRKKAKGIDDTRIKRRKAERVRRDIKSFYAKGSEFEDNREASV